MRRFLFIAFVLLVGLLLILLGTAWYLSGNEGFLKSRLDRIVQQQTGRSLTVEGPLRLEPGLITRIEAEGVRFSNPDWAQDADMVRIGRLVVAIDLPSLWQDGPITLPELAIDSCSVKLIENEAGEANWAFLPAGEADAPSEPEPVRGPLVRLPDLMVRDCRLELESPDRAEKLTAELARISLRLLEKGRLEGNGTGSLNGEQFRFDGWVMPSYAFFDGGLLEHDLDLRLGAIEMHSAGTVADAATWSGAIISGYFRGPAIESVLAHFGAPAVSDGEFDFRFGLNTEGEMTQIVIDGDLGSLDARVRGELDRLVAPQKGNVDLSVQGPDLGALGQALEVDGLVNEPYRIEAAAVFEPGRVRLEAGVIEAGQERLSVEGHLNPDRGLAGSQLDVRFQSGEIGRWAPMLGREAITVGALSLEGSTHVNDAGVVSLDARLESGDHSLAAAGTLGTLDGPFLPDLDFDFRSPDPRPLAALAGWESFPPAALAISGRAGYSDQRLRMTGVEVVLDSHRANMDGVINLAEGHAGSQLNLKLDITDIAGLGALFGLQELPAQPLSLTLTVSPEGDGVAFEAADGNIGRIQLEAEGRIADLENPLGIDAVFDVSLPSLDDLAFLVPDYPLPELPFSARGRLVNRDTDTMVERVQLTLGQLEATVGGTIGPDQNLDLKVALSGPDFSIFRDLLGAPLRAESFSMETRVAGDFRDLEFTGLDARLGESRLGGRVRLGLGDIKRIDGSLNSEYLDLSQWIGVSEEEETEPEEPAGQRDFLFDDKPVMRVVDLGIDLELKIEVADLDLGNAQIQDLRLGAVLNPNFLQLKPFSLRGQTGGTIFGEVVLDGRGQVPKIELNINGSDVRLGIGALEGQDPATMPPHEISISLSGSGMTRRELASRLDGRLRWFVGSGRVAHAAVGVLFSDFVTELFSALNPFAEKNEYTTLECAVGAADIVSGQVEVLPVILHTRELTILSHGSIDLDTEAIDLAFNTKPRQGLGLSAGALINPLIKVGGRLVSPAVELDPKGTMVSGGIAVATAGLSLLAKSMSDRFLSSKDPCGDARREIEKRDGA
jgi:uncharacterized protein involved in outer membrane biogenesis